MFVLEDESHAEPQAEFATLQDALSELLRRATIPWDEEPNLAPCVGWRTCGRRYEILEVDDNFPSRELRRIPALEVSAKGIVWITEPDALRSLSDGV